MIIKENKPLFFILSFTWGLLWTLIGALIAITIITFRGFKDKFKVVQGRVVVVLKNTDFGGISLGLFILVSRDSKALIQHELGHTVQNVMFGPLFILLIAIPSGIRYQMFGWLNKRHLKKHGEPLNYYSIWFESQATRLGVRYFNEI